VFAYVLLNEGHDFVRWHWHGLKYDEQVLASEHRLEAVCVVEAGDLVVPPPVAQVPGLEW
jgi:hypothetical protein